VYGPLFQRCCLTPPVWIIQFLHEVFRQKYMDALVLHVKTIWKLWKSVYENRFYCRQ
jgi:hypothetical protein